MLLRLTEFNNDQIHAHKVRDERECFLYFMLLCCSLMGGLPFVGGQAGPADS
jgi:hypothetical protein